MNEYIHKVHYYETDKMGVTHHSNYIRWMEEARTDYLERAGCGYDKIEAMGIISPVTALECKYLATTTYPDVITVYSEVEEFKGVKLKIRYIMKKDDGTVVFEGRSEHCFLDLNGRPIRLNKVYPELYEVFTKQQ